MTGNNPSDFIPGLQLSERYYREAVRPILDRRFPGLRYAAALLGWGSDVPGYDTSISTDHQWGPRLYLFLPEESYEKSGEISSALSEELPPTFLSYPTNFHETDDAGIRRMTEADSGPVNHMVEIFTVSSYFKSYLGMDIDQEITPADWLTFTEHRLLGCTSGKVFHDEPGELTRVRQMLAYYPRDVWLYILTAQWTKIAQEEAFVGRCGDVGDEIGSGLIAARIVSYLMRLCFLMEREYTPYPKWFGTAFSRLECAPQMTPTFRSVLNSTDWRERETHLSEAYRKVAEMHNRLGITPPLETNTRDYYGRPYQVIFAGRFADEIEKAITDPRMRELTPKIGSVSQFSDSTDVVDNVALRSRLKLLYELPATEASDE